MFALTLHQPYASLVVHGRITSWPQRNYTSRRCDIAIYATQTWMTPAFKDEEAIRMMKEAKFHSNPLLLPYGCIVGFVELVECDILDNNHTSWRFDNARIIKPIRVTGHRGFWQWHPAQEQVGQFTFKIAT